jgi:hypothetical protein
MAQSIFVNFNTYVAAQVMASSVTFKKTAQK